MSFIEMPPLPEIGDIVTYSPLSSNPDSLLFLSGRPAIVEDVNPTHDTVKVAIESTRAGNPPNAELPSTISIWCPAHEVLAD